MHNIYLMQSLWSWNSVDHRFLSTSISLWAACTSSCCSTVMCCLWLCTMCWAWVPTSQATVHPACSMYPSQRRWIVWLSCAFACWYLSEDSRIVPLTAHVLVFHVPWLLGIPDIDGRERTVALISISRIRWYAASSVILLPYTELVWFQSEHAILTASRSEKHISLILILVGQTLHGHQAREWFSARWCREIVSVCSQLPAAVQNSMRCQKLALLEVPGATNSLHVSMIWDGTSVS